MNSPLVTVTRLSPNHSGKRTQKISRITPHCVVGFFNAKDLCSLFDSPSRKASCNYGIGTDGDVGLCVPEYYRSWCSSSAENDQRAVTIECASGKTSPYEMTRKTFEKLIDLCEDICRRNGKKKLLWFADKNTSLKYEPKSDEMVLTVHRWFANKSCPGDWLYQRLPLLATTVTEKLQGTSSDKMYHVQVGAFTQKANAKVFETSMRSKGYDTFIIHKDGMYKVQVGAFHVKDNATRLSNQLKNHGISNFIDRY